MVDYTKPTGENGMGTMMIRDLGQTVEYWIRAAWDSTYYYGAPYSWVANGSSGSGTFDYPLGKPWVRVRTLQIVTSQTVQFNLGATGTRGLGGPTNFSQFIQRATVRVNVNGTWKYAVPYVNQNGTWKIAQAWINHNGTWKMGG